MLVLIPPLAIASLTIVFGSAFPSWGWRRSGLRAVLTAGLFTVLSTEILGLFGLIRQPPLALAWAIPAAIACVWLVRHWQQVRSRLPRLEARLHTLDKAIIAGMALALALTALVAYLAPPQTWDSLNYHMPRVAHWAQQGSVDAFATGIEIQDSLPPGAEFAVLHVYVLAHSDRMVNFVSWLAMMTAVVGVSLIARQLGAGRNGQLGAAAFAATLPMGLIQASSTMNDSVVALWMVLAASEAVLLANDVHRWDAAMCLACAAALGAFTKPTAIPFLLVMGVLVGGALAARRAMGRTLAYAALAAGIMLAVNAGYWARMTGLYGSPFSPEQVDLHRNQLMTPAGVISNLTRHAALHAGTPWPIVNKVATELVIVVHRVLGLDPSDPRTTNHGDFRIPPLNVQENKAGNPVHALLGLVALATAVWRRRVLPGVVHWYGFGLLGSALLFSAIFKWQIFASRYHLPFFALLAPWAAVIGEGLLRPAGIRVLSSLLLLASIPWLTGIRTRPLLPLWDEPKVGSLLTESRQRLMFASGDYLEAPYTEMTDLIGQQACGQVGLMLGGPSAEYPLWVLLGAPRPDLRIEWIVGGTPSERYSDPAFAPCAIVCESCEEQGQTIRGLPLAYSRSGYRLYLQRDR